MTSNSTREPNPLRPYYKPPSIGIPQDLPPPPSNPSASQPFRSGSTHSLGAKHGSAARYASSARDMFNDLDYADYLSENSPSSLESVHRQLNEWTSKYFGVLLAQPFDVAKTILQVREQGDVEGVQGSGSESGRASSRESYRREKYSQFHEDEDSDPDEHHYFTSAAPHSSGYDTHSRSRQRQRVERSRTPSPGSTTPDNQLLLKRSDAIMEVISQEWTKEGAWGVWKASNATFMYSILHQTLEKWLKGMLSAALNVPDQGLAGIPAELVDAQYPWASLGVAIGAAVTSGLILAPLDLVRTKLMITSISTPSRSLTQAVRHLPTYLIPLKLLLPTLLYESISPTLHHTTPLILRSQLSIDPILTPSSYSLLKLLSRTTELFIKLPFETVLRRAQASVLQQSEYATDVVDGKVVDFEPIVRIGAYNGVVGTIWGIMRDEGVREGIVKKGGRKGKVERRTGQGVEGLWRGWRVGMWGLVGVWGSGMLSGSASGGEF